MKLIKNVLVFVCCFSIWFFLNAQGCTKKIVYAKNYNTQPYKAYYMTDKSTVMDAVRKVLENSNYAIHDINPESGRIITGWKPVESDSHYFDLFGRKDFGTTDGSYYQLIVDLMPETSRIKVLVSTTVKSITGKLETNQVVERRFIKQLDHLMRSPQIEITNVGVEKK